MGRHTIDKGLRPELKEYVRANLETILRLDSHKNTEAKQVIKEARQACNYSQNTVSVDIWSRLRSVAQAFDKGEIL